ncbi:MAG: hypothetical protein LBB17_03725, partial [Puniceicoccales bacterium]|nr:hypothetical protein [Puniceicoccales bacterium]
MPKIQELGNTGYVLSPPPPPSGTAESSRPASPESPLDHQIDVFDRTVDPFIIRLTGIEDVELQEREVHIAKMGNAPTDSEEVRKSKSFEFMNELWYKAEDIFNNSRDAIIQKMAEQGKEFSELAGKAIVFANLLMQNVSNSKCISCQMPTSNGPEKLFFPIEVIKKPEEYVNVVKKLASAVKELPKQDPRSFLQVIHEKVLRGLDDDFAEERDQKLEVFGVDDWCDARLALDPGILRDVVNSCVKS